MFFLLAASMTKPARCVGVPSSASRPLTACFEAPGAAVMVWRGIIASERCEHGCCSDGGPCRFAVAPVFDTAEARDSYIAACASEPSHPDGFHHGTSLLTDWSHIAAQLLPERAKILADLDPIRAARCREFFVNKRDAPVFMHSTAATAGAAQMPIMSQYSDSATAPPAAGDVAMPNLEDYRRCFPGRFFGKSLAAEEGLPEAPLWEHRRSCAVFRGGATGEGICPETNPRLKLAVLSEEWSHFDGDQPLLDARLTSWNQRQKVGKDGVLRILDRTDLARRWGLKDVGRRHFLSWAQQASCKYAVYLDGNVGAGRLGALLGLGFVVLAPSSRKPATYMRMHLKPMVHFIPLREDLSDLRPTLLWLRQNDEAARCISENAQRLHRRWCSQAAMQREMRWLVSSLPPPDETSFRATLEHIWCKARAAIYVLLDDELHLRIFAPFANRDYTNDWPEVKTEAGGAPAFLARVRKLTGERVTLPWRKWWLNGGLVCNVMPEDVWGESQLPELRLLLENISA